ncbi:glutathione peroxidase [Brucepastera parasyntrophica]|uniref:glutathione peroxidase n=1 Tax=Brucepastera parasyntrophica TaxID=2880008 RepID=UPI003F6EBB0F
MTVYDFTVKDKGGADVSLSEYKGKVLLIVNTATKCGLTPQYEALEALYKKYHDRGLEILDFPSNQFLKQAPGTDEEINNFCTLNYGTTFPALRKLTSMEKTPAHFFHG